MRNYLLRYLATRLTVLPSFVIQPLISCAMRITKLGYLIDSQHAEIVSMLTPLVTSNSIQHQILGAKVLKELVEAMEDVKR